MISADRVSIPRNARSRRTERPELWVERDPREPLVERLATRAQPIARGEVVDERQLGVLMLEGLRRQPLAVRLSPGGAVPHAAVAQQQLREAMPAAHQVEPDLLACPGQVPRRLERGRRDRDRVSAPAIS